MFNKRLNGRVRTSIPELSIRPNLIVDQVLVQL